MLTNLHVKNLALIEESEVNFGEGLNILTGETGAGKSIIIGSINYCLGAKTGSDVIREGAEYALVELVFQVDNEAVINSIKELELPIEEDGTLILTRKIMPNRSIFKICGETVTAKQMKEIASLLIDIHGQHEHQSLLSEKKQAKILDAFAPQELETIKADISKLVKEHNALKKEKEELSGKSGEKEREISLARYEIEEIEKADLKLGEYEELEKKYNKLKNSKRIMEALGRARDYICEGNGNALDSVGYGARELQGAAAYDDELSDMSNRMADIEAMLLDMSRDLVKYMDDSEFGEEEFDNIESRLDIINHMTLKYGGDVSKVLEYLEARRAELNKLEDLQGYMESINLRMVELENKILELCGKAHDIRLLVANKLSKEITEVLEDLNFLKVEFGISVNERENFNEDGYDDVSFDISLNPGERLKPISEVASGGELSRIMLALKTVFAKYDGIDTLIFDEIDTGISGKTAWKVSERMGVLAKERQVICITHLPQIAAMADVHFKIEKNEVSGRTVTDINEVASAGLVDELSRMLGSDCITDAVRQNAMELKAMADKVKGL